MTPDKLVAVSDHGAAYKFSFPVDLAEFPVDALGACLRSARHIVADLELELSRRNQVMPDAPEPERAIRIEEAAPLMGLTYGYAIRHWRRLGAFKDSDGRVKFPTSVVRARAVGAAPSGA